MFLRHRPRGKYIHPLYHNSCTNKVRPCILSLNTLRPTKAASLLPHILQLLPRIRSTTPTLWVNNRWPLLNWDISMVPEWDTLKTLVHPLLLCLNMDRRFRADPYRKHLRYITCINIATNPNSSFLNKSAVPCPCQDIQLQHPRLRPTSPIWHLHHHC